MKDGSAGKEGARERTPGGKYRCPYCRGAIETPRGKCPACGKMLRPPDCAPGAAGRRERRRKIGLIKKDAERQKAALGGFAPSGRRSPLFYLAVISGLAVLGVAFMNAMRRAGSGPAGEDRKIVRAMRGADTIAEALGRFKFHNGEYPLEQGAEGLSRHDGIAALVEKEPVRYPKSRGPYLKARRWIPGENGERSVPAPIEDPWGRPYEYALSTNGTPSVTSFGPDGKRGTDDDIHASAAAFEKPFVDTSWTNDWVHYTKRGIIVRPTPPEERIVEDNGEAIFPWLLGGVCVLGAVLLALVAALWRFRLPKEPAAGAAAAARDSATRRDGPAARDEGNDPPEKRNVNEEKRK